MGIVTIVISLFVLLFAITVHEAAHAWSAKKFGDPTAAALGRATLNPLAHIDPFGTILLPFLLVLIGMPAFGWAKPVPVNPYNLRDPRRDNIWISAAGPISNLTVAFVSFVILVILRFTSTRAGEFIKATANNLIENRGLAFPVLAPGFYPFEGLALLLFMFVLINSYLALFNLIPIPPLDGSGVLLGILPYETAQRYERIRPFGFIIVLALIYIGLLDILILPITLVLGIILGGPQL